MFCSREVKILHYLASDFVVRLIAFGRDPSLGYCVVLERGTETLRHLLDSRQGTPASRRALCTDLFRIMRFLQSRFAVAPELNVRSTNPLAR